MGHDRRTGKEFLPRPHLQRTMTMTSLAQGYRALVLGATGTLGGAFVRAFATDSRCAEVECLSRSSHPPIELTRPETLEHAASLMLASAPFDVVIDATGALTVAGQGPEKRLADLDPDRLQAAFAINAIGRGLVLRHFTPLLPRNQRCLFAVLSARVGSIEDNHLGGWYAYRAAKAAGNMLLQTAAIEVHRLRPLAVFAAMQPGTVHSPLSAPYTGNHAAIDADESVAGLLATLDRLQPDSRAHFVDHQGNAIPW